MTATIPVVGTALVNGVHWLRRQIASVDYPIQDYVVINNNGRGEITQELDDLAAQDHPLIGKIHMVHMPGNIGCAGAWNLIVKSRLMSPYWLITGHDIEFSAGMLALIAERVEDEQLGMIFADAGEHGWGAWNLFVIRDWVIRDFGLFDENFYPAYAEDVDYLIRLNLHPIRMQRGLEIQYNHGGGPSKDYASHGSQTWRTDPSLKSGIDRGRIINEEEYMLKKWGAEWWRFKTHRSPFDLPNQSVRYWIYDLEFARRKYLGF
jgi:GT2 family glycosyltransferase